MPKTPTTSDEIKLPDEKQFVEFYALQNNNICQQENAKQRIHKLIKIFKTFSKDVGKWKDKWIAFDGKHQSKIPDYKSTWNFFRISTSLIAGYTENIVDIIEKLEAVKESIPNPDKTKTLKTQIDKARVEIDKLDQEIKDLKATKNKLEQKITNGQEKTSKSFASCISPQTSVDELVNRQSSTIASIDDKRSTLEQKVYRFNNKKVSLYETSREDEIKRCKDMQKYATDFLGVFGLTNDDFTKESKTYDAAKDMNDWEEKNDPLKRSQSTKDKTNRDDSQ